jgi:hypothetical protein
VKRSALQALEQAFQNHEPCMVSLQVDAIFDLLREEEVIRICYVAWDWNRDLRFDVAPFAHVALLNGATIKKLKQRESPR